MITNRDPFSTFYTPKLGLGTLESFVGVLFRVKRYTQTNYNWLDTSTCRGTMYKWGLGQ